MLVDEIETVGWAMPEPLLAASSENQPPSLGRLVSGSQVHDSQTQVPGRTAGAGGRHPQEDVLPGMLRIRRQGCLHLPQERT